MPSESKEDAQERLLLLEFTKWLESNGLAVCTHSFGQWRPEGRGADLAVRFFCDRRAAPAKEAAP